MNQLPKTRVIDGAEQKVGNCFYIYDKALNNLHCLDTTATLLYLACRQEISFANFKAETHLSNEAIFVALDDLRKENLLENNQISADKNNVFFNPPTLDNEKEL